MENKKNQMLHTFVHEWGELGAKWGMSRVMAQVHALLMVSAEPLSTDDVMENLSISRGHANTALRQLLEWNVARRLFKKGERKEFFESEKDIWAMLCQIGLERKKREVEPAIRGLKQCLEEVRHEKDMKHFKYTVNELLGLLNTMDFFLSKLADQQQSKMLPRLFKLFS